MYSWSRSNPTCGTCGAGDEGGGVIVDGNRVLLPGGLGSAGRRSTAEERVKGGNFGVVADLSGGGGGAIGSGGEDEGGMGMPRPS